MTDPGGDGRRQDDAGPASRRPAVIGLVVVLALVVAAYFLVNALRQESNLEDCLMSGRHNCTPLDLPPRK